MSDEDEDQVSTLISPSKAARYTTFHRCKSIGLDGVSQDVSSHRVGCKSVIGIGKIDRPSCFDHVERVADIRQPIQAMHPPDGNADEGNQAQQ